MTTATITAKKVDIYYADQVVDVTFTVAGVQSTKRAEDADYDKLAGAGFTQEAVETWLAAQQ